MDEDEELKREVESAVVEDQMYHGPDAHPHHDDLNDDFGRRLLEDDDPIYVDSNEM